MAQNGLFQFIFYHLNWSRQEGVHYPDTTLQMCLHETFPTVNTTLHCQPNMAAIWYAITPAYLLWPNSVSLTLIGWIQFVSCHPSLSMHERGHYTDTKIADLFAKKLFLTVNTTLHLQQKMYAITPAYLLWPPLGNMTQIGCILLVLCHLNEALSHSK